MGMRLHYAQHYAPEWKGGYFNWDSERWDDLFHSKFYENGWAKEDMSEYEVFRGDIKDYIKEIRRLPADDFNEFFPNDDKYQTNGYTNEQVIEVLEELLLSDDEHIRLEWF